ncbi:MAG: hypothetical protein MRY21_04835 [Simkaniaceae bacterium]|nr:hypothetical protein [Simkaniaceae bacterium]
MSPNIKTNTPHSVAPVSLAPSKDKEKFGKLSQTGVFVAQLHSLVNKTDVKGAKKPAETYTLHTHDKKNLSYQEIMALLSDLLVDLQKSSMELQDSKQNIDKDFSTANSKMTNQAVVNAKNNLQKLNHEIHEKHKWGWLKDLGPIIAVVSVIASAFVGPAAFVVTALVATLETSGAMAKAQKALAKAVGGTAATIILAVAIAAASLAGGAGGAAESLTEGAAEDAESEGQGALKKTLNKALKSVKRMGQKEAFSGTRAAKLALTSGVGQILQSDLIFKIAGDIAGAVGNSKDKSEIQGIVAIVIILMTMVALAFGVKGIGSVGEDTSSLGSKAAKGITAATVGGSSIESAGGVASGVITLNQSAIEMDMAPNKATTELLKSLTEIMQQIVSADNQTTQAIIKSFGNALTTLSSLGTVNAAGAQAVINAI